VSSFHPSSEHPFPVSHHASTEEYATFVYAYTESQEYRRHLLYWHTQFVQYYPHLGDWFAAPLPERVGRLYGESKYQPSYRLSFQARHYLMFLAWKGYAPLDWEWLIAVHYLKPWQFLQETNPSHCAGINQLVEEAVGLGYKRKPTAEPLHWLLGRMFLAFPHLHINALNDSHLQSLAEALLLFGERSDLALFFGSAERAHQQLEHYKRWIFKLQIILYHRGQTATLPRVTRPSAPREVLRPRMEAVVTRYLAARRLDARPSTVKSFRIALHLLIPWLAQEYPELETFAEVTREHLIQFAEALNTMKGVQTHRPFASGTKQLMLSCLSIFFQQVARWQWDDVPARPLLLSGDLPQRSQRVPRYIPEDELGRLMQAIRSLACPYQRAALLIARWSGARRGEIRHLAIDCLDGYPDSTARLHIPAGKTYKERLVPLHEEAAEAIRELQRRKTGARGIRNEQTGKEVRYLFMSRGKVLSDDYLFADSLQKVCQVTGITASDGKALVTPHRFRHTLGTQLTNRGARLNTVMKVLGHDSARMALVYAQISDQEVLKDYQAVLGPGAVIAGPAAEVLRSGELSTEAVDWLKSNLLKTELELGRCLRLPQEGPCECDLYLTCAKFVTTPAYAPRLRRRRRVEQELVEDATAHGWQREVERHQCTIRRLEQLLAALGEPSEGPEATD
jgi:integrase